MSPEELKQYAETLIRDAVEDFEFLTIHEMAVDYSPNGEITDDEASVIADLIASAEITIAFPDAPGSDSHVG